MQLNSIKPMVKRFNIELMVMHISISIEPMANTIKFQELCMRMSIIMPHGFGKQLIISCKRYEGDRHKELVANKRVSYRKLSLFNLKLKVDNID